MIIAMIPRDAWDDLVASALLLMLVVLPTAILGIRVMRRFRADHRGDTKSRVLGGKSRYDFRLVVERRGLAIILAFFLFVVFVSVMGEDGQLPSNAVVDAVFFLSFLTICAGGLYTLASYLLAASAAPPRETTRGKSAHRGVRDREIDL